MYANILSLPYPIFVFAFGRLQDDPRPSKGYWRAMLGYSTFVILLKYVFQLLPCVDGCNTRDTLTGDILLYIPYYQLFFDSAYVLLRRIYSELFKQTLLSVLVLMQ